LPGVIMNRRPLRLAAAAVLAAALAACASSTKLDAQWADAQAASPALRGAKVLVACEAYDTTIRQICMDQLAAEVTARGATAVAAPEIADVPRGQPVPVERYVSIARASGAAAVVSSTVVIADRQVSQGVSVGLGGFGFGGGNVRGGLGVSVPIGGGQVSTAYQSDTRITSVASGRMLWSGKATAPASRDVGEQMASLARTLLDAADKAGMF
jgi:hypothetical protein